MPRKPQPAPARDPAPKASERPPRPIADNRRETVDMAHRPGPGERQDAERPLLQRDPESQNGGRSMEEELVLQSSEDDAGGLPNQQLANRGPLPGDEGRVLPEAPDRA
jgi:hypothetical protein